MSEDLKIELKRWFNARDKDLPDPTIEEALINGADLGESIGYQRGRAYERKLILKVAEQYFHECQLEREAPTLDMFERMINEPHKEY